ncbi:MAG: hypothetical protein JOS17DRAFT_737182 [Linnemannia elongata]|nr:MAG: hypothetical protein JOS17DRAFT_737182 [Linnemannia elongata]
MASHSSYRQSVLDPALEGIRRYRSPSSSRAIATSVPYAPSPLSPPPPPPTHLSGTASSSALTSPTQAEYPSRLLPPPRSSTPLPMPPKTPPPFAKSSTASSSSVASGLVSLPITMPPTSPPPTPRPKDRKRSTSSSVMIQQGNQPFVPTPPTPTPPSRPPPHSRTILPVNMVQESGHYQDFHEQSQQQQREMDQGWDSRRTTQYYSDESSYNRHMEQEMRESQREQSERVSRLMGQRMLQGWTMLQDTCPNSSCNGVPLMRSREKKEICVACGKDPRAAANGEPGQGQRQGQGHEQGQGHGQSRGQGQGPASSIAYPTSPTSITSPRASVMMSPPLGASSPHYKTTSSRAPRDMNGRVSSSIILPPPQRTSRHLSSDLDKLASEDEETNSHIQLIGHVNEFSSRSLPPVPPVPAIHSSHSNPSTPSRPASTYSNSSGYSPSEKERSSSSRNHQHNIGHFSILPAPPAPTPLSPEEEAVVHATHKTISVLLVKLEMYRSAFEVSDNPKESQALANHIRGTMECLKACRQVL